MIKTNFGNNEGARFDRFNDRLRQEGRWLAPKNNMTEVLKSQDRNTLSFHYHICISFVCFYLRSNASMKEYVYIQKRSCLPH